MLSDIGAVFPIGVAAALSTVPLLVTIALLLAPNGRMGALYFMVGWIAGLFGVAALFGLGLSVLSPRSTATEDPLFATIEMVIGFAFFSFGVALLVKKRSQNQSSAGGAWAKRLNGMRPLTAAGLGIVLNLRPKALLLAAAVGVVVGVGNSGAIGSLMPLLVYTALGCSTVAIPVIVTLLRPHLMEPRLLEARSLIERNQRVVTGVVLIMVGAILIGNGLVRLGG